MEGTPALFALGVRLIGPNACASPVTSSPAVAKGKVVVATADGQVICFG